MGVPVVNLNITGTLPNCARVTLATWMYEDPADVQFAGTVISLPGNSLKYSITIENWDFFRYDNTNTIAVDKLVLNTLGAFNINATKIDVIFDNQSPPNVKEVSTVTNETRYSLRFQQVAMAG